MLAGAGLISIDGWLSRVWPEAQFDRLIDSLRAVNMFVGVLLIVGWAVYFLSTGDHRRQIVQYRLAEQSYGYRRFRLLQDIRTSGRTAHEPEQNGT